MVCPMGLIYPIHADVPEDSDAGYDDFAGDLTPNWAVQLQLVDEDGDEVDTAVFGPMSPRDAWDLGNELEERIGVGLTIELVPLHPERTADEVLELIVPVDSEDLAAEAGPAADGGGRGGLLG